MHIIPTSKGDIPEIQRIASQSWQENYKGIISQNQIDYMLDLMYSDAEFQLQFENPDYHYFFVENEVQKRIGFFGIEKNAEKDSTKLHRLYLLKSEKGKGFGKLAVDFIKNWTEEQGNTRIILNVNKYNPAQEFYLKAGFKKYDEGIFDIGKGFVMDDYLMEYKIN